MISARAIDIAVVIAYLVGITAYGVWAGRKANRSTESYFLAGRKLGWAAIGFSLFATNISLDGFVGGNGMAYRIGIASFVPELTGGLMLTISALVFIPIFLRSKIFTIPQFLELRYNRASKVLLGVLFVCQSLLIAPLMTYTAAIAALGLFGFEISVANVLTAAVIITAIVGTYSIIGGLTSVVVTDIVQVLIMLAGGLAVTALGLAKVGGLGALFSSGGSEMFTLLRPADDPYLPWNAIIPGQLTNALFFSCASYSILQRALGASDVGHAQKGLLLGAFLKMF
ncbi:MAG TPA: hypothetical protein VFT13_10705, partial [Candidatus Krumholzibacteria bacterium]|nr:hypothetical protein [Candidatus Krumholzibacteria bacterium]